MGAEWPERVGSALDALAGQFANIDWEYQEIAGKPGQSTTEQTFGWRTSEDEEVAVCVFRGRNIHERFHRQSYFFFNFAYQGDYDALSGDRYNRITVREGELYVSQPFAGYALRGNPERECTILGILVRVETFVREFLPSLSVDADLLEFYLAPTKDSFAESFHHLHPSPSSGVKQLLEAMAVEYASGAPQSQQVLKSLALALAQMTVRQLRAERPKGGGDPDIVDRMVSRIRARLGNITLEGIADEFGYHPNYVSALISKKTGKTFREQQIDARMTAANMLLERSELSVQAVSQLVGYASTSSFYKEYRSRFGAAPRQRA